RASGVRRLRDTVGKSAGARTGGSGTLWVPALRQPPGSMAECGLDPLPPFPNRITESPRGAQRLKSGRRLCPANGLLERRALLVWALRARVDGIDALHSPVPPPHVLLTGRQ